jgi:hypothetical protein
VRAKDMAQCLRSRVQSLALKKIIKNLKGCQKGTEALSPFSLKAGGKTPMFKISSYTRRKITFYWWEIQAERYLYK